MIIPNWPGIPLHGVKSPPGWQHCRRCWKLSYTKRSTMHFGFGRIIQPMRLHQADLNSIASKLADRRFQACPRLHNELLNRQKPSSNAVAAQNTLLRNMVLNEGKPRLGIEGFPAEGGLFASILGSTGLYARDGKRLRFVSPTESGDDPCRLTPMWKAAFAYIKKHRNRTIAVSELFNEWRKPPFGVRGRTDAVAGCIRSSCRNGTNLPSIVRGYSGRGSTM